MNIMKQRQYANEFKGGENDAGESDSDEDEHVKRIDRMNQELEDLFKQKKEYLMEKDRKMAKSEKK